MYNTVLNQVYNCRSLGELISRLETLGQENAKFDIVAKRIKALKESANKGNVEDATLLTQMMVNLHASKGEYVICKANKDKNGFNLTIQTTDTDYEARNYRREWSGLFAGGASKYIGQDQDGNYTMKGSFKPSVFNGLGIMFDIDMLNYMLSTKYGSTDYQAMNKFFSETQVVLPNGKQVNVGIRQFASFISGFNVGGKLNVTKTNIGYLINGVNIRSVFSGRGTGFVGTLATWAYNYKKSQDQLSILANK